MFFINTVWLWCLNPRRPCPACWRGEEGLELIYWVLKVYWDVSQNMRCFLSLQGITNSGRENVVIVKNTGSLLKKLVWWHDSRQVYRPSVCNIVQSGHRICFTAANHRSIPLCVANQRQGLGVLIWQTNNICKATQTAQNRKEGRYTVNQLCKLLGYYLQHTSVPKMTKLVIFLVIALTVNSLVESKLTTISEDNWRDILEGEWMVEL